MPVRTPPILDEINDLVMALYVEYASHEPDSEQITAAFAALWNHIDINTQKTRGVLSFGQRFTDGNRKIEVEIRARIIEVDNA